MINDKNKIADRLRLLKIYLTMVLTFIFPSMLLSQTQSTQSTQTEVHLSAAEKPGKLVVNHTKGSINVKGYDGKLVIIIADFRQPKEQSKKIVIDAVESHNEVTVATNLPSSTIDLTIYIPRNFSLKLQTYHNGKINVQDIWGEMEISNSNGEIILNDVSGSAILNTIDGNITAVFNEVSQGVPMAFTTIYGNIDLSFPEYIEASFKLKSEYGDTNNEFPMVFEQRKSPKKSGANKSYLEEWIHGKVNGGGAEILIQSFDGNIYLRKK